MSIHFASRYITVSIFLLAYVFAASVCIAEDIPQNLASMAAELLKSVRTDIESPAGDADEIKVLERAYKALKEEKMFLWGRKSLALQGVVPQLATALGLTEVNPEDIPNLQKFIDTSSDRNTDAAIREFYKAYGRPMLSDAKLSTVRKKVDEARASALGDLSRHHTIKNENGRQLINLDWNPEVGEFSISVRDFGDETGEPFITTIKGDVEAEVSEDGKDLNLAVVPEKEPIQTITAEDLAETYESIFGEWHDADGDRWIIAPVDKGVQNKTDTLVEDTEPKPGERIKAMEDRIKEIKKSRIYVWENTETGERIEQVRFRRLKEPFEYKDKDVAYSIPNAEEEISRLEQEISELKKALYAKPKPIESPPPPKSRDEPDSEEIRITEFSNKGYIREFPEAWYSYGRIDAQRTMSDIRELNPKLSEGIKRQLLGGWKRPDWIELSLKSDPEKGELALEGLDWGMHVTHDGDNEVYRVHTPFSGPLKLTRSTGELVIKFTNAEFNPIDEVIVLVPELVGTGTSEVWVEVEVPPDHPDFNDSLVEELEVKVTSDIDPEGEIAVCVETAPDSRIFRSQKAIEISITMGIEG